MHDFGLVQVPEGQQGLIKYVKGVLFLEALLLSEQFEHVAASQVLGDYEVVRVRFEHLVHFDDVGVVLYVLALTISFRMPYSLVRCRPKLVFLVFYTFLITRSCSVRRERALNTCEVLPSPISYMNS